MYFLLFSITVVLGDIWKIFPVEPGPSAPALQASLVIPCLVSDGLPDGFSGRRRSLYNVKLGEGEMEGKKKVQPDPIKGIDEVNIKTNENIISFAIPLCFPQNLDKLTYRLYIFYQHE